MNALRLLLVVAALSPSRVAPSIVPGLVSDVVTAAAAEGASWDDAAIAATFAVCEGAGRADAIGDSGAAIGTMQLHVEHWRGHGRDEVLADRVLQVRLWLHALALARDACGTTAAGLGRLATGRCGGAPRLVARRRSGRC